MFLQPSGPRSYLGYGNPFHNLEHHYRCGSSRLSPGKKPFSEFSERVRTQRLAVDGKVLWC